MNNFKTGRISNQAKSVQLLAVLVLLSVYLAGALELSTLHTLFHDPVAEQNLHSEINEKNSCHQVLYHNAKESCEHPTHFTAVKKCAFCQLSIQSYHLFDANSTQQLAFYSRTELAFTHAPISGEPCFHLAPRAPPLS